MLRLTLSLLCVILLVATCLASGDIQHRKDDWVETPYENRDFNVKAEYGDHLILLCNDSRVDGLNYVVTKWIRPDLEVMYANDTDMFFTLDGNAGWTVNEDGMEMNITIVQERHFGIYYCVTEVQGENREIVVKIGLNMWGPSYGDVWPKYKDAVIWASSLTLAFIIALIVGFVVYTRNEEPESLDEDEEVENDLKIPTQSSSSHAYDNAAFNNAVKPAFEETTEL